MFRTYNDAKGSRATACCLSFVPCKTNSFVTTVAKACGIALVIAMACFVNVVVGRTCFCNHNNFQGRIHCCNGCKGLLKEVQRLVLHKGRTSLGCVAIALVETCSWDVVGANTKF